MRFCLAHPDRCSGLVLIVPMAYAPQRAAARAPSAFFASVLNTISSSDFLYWAATKVARPILMKTILGTPVDDYRSATPDARRGADLMLRSIFPISRRAAGIENDSAVSSTLTRDRLEDIKVPALLISAANDLYGTYENSWYTAGQIADATFIGFRNGGHLLLGHDAEIRSRLTDFLNERLQGSTANAAPVVEEWLELLPAK